MARPVLFLPHAEVELVDAQRWYDQQAFGLGDRFFLAVDLLIPRIGDMPKQFPAVRGEIRRALVRHFPYALYFREETEAIYILACTHTSRNPRHALPSAS